MTYLMVELVVTCLMARKATILSVVGMAMIPCVVGLAITDSWVELVLILLLISMPLPESRLTLPPEPLQGRTGMMSCWRLKESLVLGSMTPSWAELAMTSSSVVGTGMTLSMVGLVMTASLAITAMTPSLAGLTTTLSMAGTAMTPCLAVAALTSCLVGLAMTNSKVRTGVTLSLVEKAMIPC